MQQSGRHYLNSNRRETNERYEIAKNAVGTPARDTFHYCLLCQQVRLHSIFLVQNVLEKLKPTHRMNRFIGCIGFTFPLNPFYSSGIYEQSLDGESRVLPPEPTFLFHSRVETRGNFLQRQV
jgi:hypothetical protein